MYDQSSVLIAAMLFVSMVIAIEVGFRVGGAHSRTREVAKTQTNAIQASLLGILALLLGFTFSLALQRHDNRSAAVVDEANAIGTTYLRAQLLPDDMREDVATLLRRYVDVRVAASKVSLADGTAREPLLREANAITSELWAFAIAAAREDGRPVTSGLFIQSLNELIDSYARRDAALNRHVPEIVLFLLFITFVMAGWMLGYTAGMVGHRPTFATFTMVTLIVLLVFIIIDLDRPRRGLIEVSQESLTDLQQAINAAP
jgi:hypothetical protein